MGALVVPRDASTRALLRGRALARLIWRVTLLNVRARLEYRVDFLLWMLQGAAYQAMGLTFVWAVLLRFHAIRGWSTGDVIFMFSLRLLAHSFCMTLFLNVMSVPAMIRQGTFDRVLLRPMNPLLQVLIQTFEANTAGDLTVAVALFVIAQRAVRLHWTAATLAFLVLVIVGSVLMEAGIQTAIASLSFWVVDSSPLGWWADELMNTFANYPLNVVNAVVRYFFTFVMPVAFLAYFPAAVFLGKARQVTFTPLFAYGAPAAGVVAFAVAYAFWLRGLRRYQGTGT